MESSIKSVQLPVTQGAFESLYIANLIPLYVCLVGLVWVLHDYLITIHDEIRFIWAQKTSLGKFVFLWIRYYTIALLIFDVTQIHYFARATVRSDSLCVAMDSIIRVVGAISLWSVEIVLQLRIYALYNCNRKVAWTNAVLFFVSIVLFFVILAHNAVRRHSVIADAIHLPLPGCPSIHSGIEWLQWVPATVYEGILFGFALYRTVNSLSSLRRIGGELTIIAVLLRDNILYFFGIACLLIFNNLMVVGATKIPWFSYSPFHAAIGIFTTRMLLSIREATTPVEPPADPEGMEISLRADDWVGGDSSAVRADLRSEPMMFVLSEASVDHEELMIPGPSRLRGLPKIFRESR